MSNNNMTDEELIVAVINDPDGKYGRLYDHMMLNGWKWAKIVDVMRKHKLSMSSYLADTLRSSFP
jgi:hypothetical protein